MWLPFKWLLYVTNYRHFLYWFIYIHLFTVNCKNDNKIKTGKQRCWQNFSNRKHLGTIKQTLNDSFVNRVNDPRIKVHHLNRKSNETWMQTLTEETKGVANVTKAVLEKISTTIKTTVEQCKNELKTNFREAIAP